VEQPRPRLQAGSGDDLAERGPQVHRRITQPRHNRFRSRLGDIEPILEYRSQLRHHRHKANRVAFDAGPPIINVITGVPRADDEVD
jgi:hypothetical protein